MKIEHIKAENTVTSTWSGGTTTEVYIYPQGADYKKRDFKFRLSMAVAHDEYSTYTELEGVKRYLISLKNTAVITHEGRYSVVLAPFGDVDCFMGDWKTTAQGAIHDFNLMLANGAMGSMEVVREKEQQLQPEYSHIAFYFTEDAKAVICEREYSLHAGDALIISDIRESGKIKLLCENVGIIRCNVRV